MWELGDRECYGDKGEKQEYYFLVRNVEFG